MEVNILIGGKAGQGPNVLANILAKALIGQGFYVFCSRDYQSLIRGGHNFNVLTISNNPKYSNDSKTDILVCLDEKTAELHKKEMKKTGIILKDHTSNMYYAGKVFKLLGLDFKTLDNELKELKERYEENLKESKEGYENERPKIDLPKLKKKELHYITGSQGISEGAIKSGLDVYYGYPMTPATAVLMELGGKEVEKNFLVLELENEIAVMNAAIGSAITGAKSMIGTAGGGFDLMTEALSLSGAGEIPIVAYLAQRAGASTGVPTYTGQEDLKMAMHAGHGEFVRMVLAPGDPNECQELTSQAFYFSQKFKVPVIVISDKHLAESFYTLDKKPNIISSLKSTSLRRYSSYEQDKTGAATDDPKIINVNAEKRIKKQKEIAKEAKKFSPYKIYRKKDSKNVVVSWGSTKGAILDAINGLNCKFLQVLYIDPFSEEIKKELQGKNIILVENNSTAQLGQLIAEKTGIFIDDKNKILRYDARPFLGDELNVEIRKRIK